MPMARRRRPPSVAKERAIYGQIVAALGYPEPSTLLHRLTERRAERLSPEALLPRWRTAAAEASAEAAWNMYVHVPFCKSICTFCNYKRLKVSSREALDEYAAFIEQEAALFAPAFGEVKFGAIYVGGGTPSVLSAGQLERVFGALFQHFQFAEGAQKNFEFDPMVMTPDRYEMVSRFGFTRFSFGIQSIDVEVNALHNRGRQQRGHLDKQFALLDAHKAQSANVDFLLGLDGTTPEGMLAEMEEVLSKHRPDEVTVYFLHPTPAYLAKHFGGDVARFRAHLTPFEDLIPEALAELAPKLDYAIGGDGKHAINLRTLRPRKHGTQQGDHHYCDVPSQVHRPLYLLGFGDSARSRIFGELAYRAEHETDDRDPSSPRYIGSPCTDEDEMFGYLAFVFRDGDRLDRALFERTFGRDVVQAYEGPLKKLKSLDAVRVNAVEIRMRPQSREDRLRDLLFFLPPGRRRELGELPAR